MESITSDQKRAVILAMTAIADAIRDLGTVPSGELYAQVMGHLSFESYTVIIETLKRGRLVAEHNHLLTWIGPRYDS